MTVASSTGLTDAHPVLVTATNLHAAEPVISETVFQHCRSIGTFPWSTTATTSATFPVRREFIRERGRLVQCGTASGNCVVLAVGSTNGTRPHGLATTPITFAAQK